MTVRTTLSLLIICSFLPVANAQTYRRQDTALGGLAGAVIGGIIGHQNDETPEGALIGGAVGAIAGNVLGQSKDRQISHQRYHQHQAYHQHQQQQYRQQVQISRAVGLSDVVQMSQRGLSDAVIVNHIQSNGVLQQVGTREIISLHESGVSERVITAMQHAPMAGGARRETVVVQRPRPPRETVIVEHAQPVRPTVVVRKEYHYPSHPRHAAPRPRYTTRPAFPTYPSRATFHRYW